MSNPIKSSECIYPECGPTCRKDCPPLPAKPIEPTEEQKQAARDFMTAPPSGETVHAELARLLAEREAKLRGEYDASVAYYKAQADAYRLDAQVLQAHLDTARAHARTHARTLKADLDGALMEAMRMVDEVAPPKFRAFDVTERPVAMDAVAGKGCTPASCPKCSDDARPVGDGERWVCSVCRRPCRIPINDTEGGEG